jgi:hypothetical protein
MPLEDGQPSPSCTPEERPTVSRQHTGLYLAESFARQEGWLVREERIRWKDWLRQQGLAEPEKESKLKRLTGKARQMLRKIVSTKSQPLTTDTNNRSELAREERQR